MRTWHQLAWEAHKKETPLPLQYLFQERQVFEGLPHTAAKDNYFAMRAPARPQC